ncbi:olfactory receptor 2L3-like [Leptodactylus fuscus]|uniref:olfactory receptor 2L3-like n=1 Tax=Leptodactylus fuscus TaxID=238119 RepID=UPI003F4EC9C1
MENFTSLPTGFHILPFSFIAQSPAFILALFTGIYLLGVLLNALIVTLIYLDKQLHSPMYLFLCNLSFVDMSYTTTVIPRLLYMLSSGNYKVSFRQCFTQIFFFFVAAGSEDLLLFTMAYDRYVAICKPLHYHTILSNKVCSICIVSLWSCSALNSCLLTVSTMNMSFCHSTTIHHFYCDMITLMKISCAGKEILYYVIYFDGFVFGLFPFLCSLTSYTKILKVILLIKSGDGRKKAFSTCSSHLIVIMFYYSTAASVYFLPSSRYSDIQEQVCSLLYATVTPMLNPLIYSLRNKDVKAAVRRLLWIKYK